VAFFFALPGLICREGAVSMMKVTSAEFIKSAFEETDWPHDRKPEIALLGRSNVGKSSFINSLLGVRGLARTSSTPGRTQSVNFFLVSKCLPRSVLAQDAGQSDL
jgi:GTP-binding protein EngB required for normal cell division